MNDSVTFFVDSGHILTDYHIADIDIFCRLLETLSDKTTMYNTLVGIKDALESDGNTEAAKKISDLVSKLLMSNGSDEPIVRPSQYR